MTEHNQDRSQNWKHATIHSKWGMGGGELVVQSVSFFCGEGRGRDVIPCVPTSPWKEAVVVGIRTAAGIHSGLQVLITGYF
jgi:hypothetical protein